MAGLSERKQNSLYGADEEPERSVVEGEQNDLQTSRLPGQETRQEGVPHLEGILDKISTIMSEPVDYEVEGLERAHQSFVEPNIVQNSHEVGGADGFVPNQPINLLAPYSEVLNDVRDYFKDKHSLDPNDGLFKDGQESLFQGQSVFQPENKREDLQQVVTEKGVDDRFGLKSNALNSGDEIFSPVQFEQPLHEPSAGEIAPLSQDDPKLQPNVAAFRRELMDRIGQMEQVIGHHFGTQKSLADDAAKAAVRLTLEAIDETPIGHRLTELEKSLEDLKSALNQAGGIEALVDQADKQSVKKSSDGLVLSARQQLDALKQTDQHGLQGIGPDNPLASLGEKDKVDSKTGQMPPPLQNAPGRVFADPLKEDGSNLSGCDTDGDQDQAVDLDENKLKDMLQRKQDERAQVGQMAATEQGLDTQPNDARTDQNELDPFLSKSADLRAQFNRSKIVSNDEDLQTIQQKGARPAFIIITVALVLAAIFISFGNRPLGDFSIDGLLKTISFWKESAFDKKQHSSKGDKSEIALKDQQDKLQAFITDGDVSITGNINPRENENTKINRRLSHSENGKRNEFEIDPETLLPSANGRLSLPPALIGPYSLRHAAANGDASAQYEVARRFGLGQGVEQDFEQAVMWYMQAAAKGFAPAQYRLATLYERGRGVEKSLGRAQVWYQRAAQLGNVKAMHNLAVVSTALDRNNPDYQAAVYWFKQAASRNLADSQFNLAILYQNGVGVPQNLVEAYRWFSLAARQGDLDAGRRRDLLEKKLKKKELLLAHNTLQAWKPIAVKPEANKVGLSGVHVTSTMSHAEETVQRSRILTAQVLLRKLGYDLKEADGTLNDRTIAAIKKFEKDKGLPITGKVNHDLIKILNKVAL